jgi:hypothetical protein
MLVDSRHAQRLLRGDAVVNFFATRSGRLLGTIAVALATFLLVCRLHVTFGGDARHGRAEPAREVEKRPVARIHEGVSVTQEFPARGDGIAAVEIRLATYAKVNNGHVQLTVAHQVSGKWQVLATDTVLKRVLIDNAYHPFVFDPPLKVSAGERIALTITSDLGPEDAITWWMSPGWAPARHRLLVNGVEQDGTAQFDVAYAAPTGPAAEAAVRDTLWTRLTLFLDPPGQLMLLGGFSLALFGLVHLLLWPFEWRPIQALRDLPARVRQAIPARRSVRHELLMLFVLALAVRWVWVFVIPPWLGPDELAHFTYVAHIVENEELPGVGVDAGVYPDKPLEALASCEQTFCNRVSALALPRVRELNYLPVQHDFGAAREYVAANPEQRKSAAGSTASFYPPLYYLFAAAPYRAFQSEPVLTRLFSVRLVTAILSALSCVFAYLMAYEARRDRALSLVVGLMTALMPMSSFIGACANNDAAMLAASGAVCWLTARLARSPVTTIAEGTWLGVASGLVFLTKPTGAPIVLMAGSFVLFKVLFRQKGLPVLQRFGGLLSFLAVLFAAEGSWLLFRALTAPAGVSPAGEFSVVAALVGGGTHSFAAYLKDLFSVRGDWYMWWLFKSFWGLFGYQEIALREKLYAAALAGCVLGTCGFIVGAVRRRFAAIELWMLLAVIGHVIILCVVSDYLLSFATLGVPLGMQGRYFLPMLAPLMFVLACGIQVLAGRWKLVLHLLPLALFVLQLASLVTLLDAYYGIDLG